MDPDLFEMDFYSEYSVKQQTVGYNLDKATNNSHTKGMNDKRNYAGDPRWESFKQGWEF